MPPGPPVFPPHSKPQLQTSHPPPPFRLQVLVLSQPSTTVVVLQALDAATGASLWDQPQPIAVAAQPLLLAAGANDQAFLRLEGEWTKVSNSPRSPHAHTCIRAQTLRHTDTNTPAPTSPHTHTDTNAHRALRTAHRACPMHAR